MELRITTEKIGSVWLGGIEGYPQIAERALTKEAGDQDSVATVLGGDGAKARASLYLRH